MNTYSQRFKTLEERLMSKVDVDDDTGCWLWTGAIDRYGYGQIGVEGRVTGVHRASYSTFVGPIPEGLTIDHLCRVRRCLNPEHLETVTSRENTLRGDTIQARNAAKSRCPKGHPYDVVQWRKLKSGSLGIHRKCSTCRREQDAARRLAA